MDSELLKTVAGLPLPAMIAFGVAAAVIFWVSKRGITDGRLSAPSNDHPAAQVAAVIVDPTALNRATDALNKLTVVMERMASTWDALAKSTDHMAEEIGRMREELRIQREVNRRN